MTGQELREFSTELRKRVTGLGPIRAEQVAMEITLANVQAQLEIAAQLADLNRHHSRYRPDPQQLYRCVYCNKDLRLIDAGAVVDSYMNVCHVDCLPKP